MTRVVTISIVFLFIIVVQGSAQKPLNILLERRIEAIAEVRIKNAHGKVHIETRPDVTTMVIEASSIDGIEESDIGFATRTSRVELETRPLKTGKRIDLKVTLPEKRSINVETDEGEIRLSGIFSSVVGKTTTGSISTDMPLGGSSYRFTWGASRPRIVSENPIEPSREVSGGRHQISGRFHAMNEPRSGFASIGGPSKLEFYTERGVMLINVALSNAPSEIGDRPLTELAKRIIITGDSALTEAIRRAAPKGFAEFSTRSKDNRSAPSFSRGGSEKRFRQDSLVVQVVDAENRAVQGLTQDDFEVFVGNEKVVVESVTPQSESFDVVLLLDVSGSVDDYLDFVRSSAGKFLDTVSDKDSVAIYSFNEELKKLADFSKDRSTLASVLFDLEAGGGTALYDSLAFILAESIPRAKSDRTAIIILSDGDDNKSFVSFNSLNSVIEESNTLIYPLYVPSGLAVASRRDAAVSAIDPSRARYMTLTSKAQAEGERLARLSGGVYYPIKRAEEIQKAYDDIVTRLRSSYTVTYRPVLKRSAEIQSGRTRVEVKREDVTVTFRGAPAVLSR